MRHVETLTDNKFLNIKRVKYPEVDVGGYEFAERLGRNSIAFICYDRNTKEFLVNNEYKPPIDEFIQGAFGGSLDRAAGMHQVVIDEVKEEAGFTVDWNDIECVGNSFVSTQMNQFCYLYLVYVDKNKQGEREPENAVEERAETKWVGIDEINSSDDWKAIVIVAKAKDQGWI